MAVTLYSDLLPNGAFDITGSPVSSTFNGEFAVPLYLQFRLELTGTFNQNLTGFIAPRIEEDVGFVPSNNWRTLVQFNAIRSVGGFWEPFWLFSGNSALAQTVIASRTKAPPFGAGYSGILTSGLPTTNSARGAGFVLGAFGGVSRFRVRIPGNLAGGIVVAAIILENVTL